MAAVEHRSYQFHSRTGCLVSLSNSNRTANRNHPAQEFNNGVVLSHEPLRDGNLFQVRIDRKMNSWSGSIEIGVTACDPINLIFPTSATGFREGSWIMSGCSIMHDGHTTQDEYGQDLDQLAEGDRVGVMRTTAGELRVYVNGVDQGVAATGLPARVWAVIDMYGKCAQVSITDDGDQVIMNDAVAEPQAQTLTRESIISSRDVIATVDCGGATVDLLVFHERCGSLIKLSNNRRTAERRRPLDEFNNGVVMTNRPLRDDEVFEIRLDQRVDKWSGSIEIGITTHNPNTLDFPATMTNMRSGTIMMSGSGILTNGKGTRREYGEFNLDNLQDGDRIGLVRKSSGALHYYVNGVDQGVAAHRAPQVVWGVVDLYGMTVKVTIVDNLTTSNNNGSVAMCNRDLTLIPPVCSAAGGGGESITSRVNMLFRQLRETLDSDNAATMAAANNSAALAVRRDINNERLASNDEERLRFHPRCGSHSAVINDQQTAHRPHAMDDFNNAVVLTSRPLRPGELFEVRIDRMVEKWAGSIEIGVTTHSPLTLDFPSTMTNIRSGTWMMTGNGVMYNGSTALEEYGQNLDRLMVGDRVGVQRMADGSLHFYVNSIDQGIAAHNVPANVYGVIDLYGQTAQATLVDHSGSSSVSDVLDIAPLSRDTNELRFHWRHGMNANISSDGRVATRPSAGGDFNDAIVMSNRPLKDDELFEIVIERMIDRWSGSLEAGVTLIEPEELEFPSAMADIQHNTWVLSGSVVMRDGETVCNGYKLDLDLIQVGSRVGIMRRADGTLQYFLDGENQGTACTGVPTGVYAVIDLYGQCSQVALTGGSVNNDGRFSSNEMRAGDIMSVSGFQPHLAAGMSLHHTGELRGAGSSDQMRDEENMERKNEDSTSHRFSACAGRNITFDKSGGRVATRSEQSYDHGLVFSSEPLKTGELFEVKVDRVSNKWAGSLRIGLTTMTVSDTTSQSILPSSATELRVKGTWIITRSEVLKNGACVQEFYCPSLERLEVDDLVGVKRLADGTMHLFLNGEDFGVAASNIPQNVFAVVDLFGCVDCLSVVSSVTRSSTMPLAADNTDQQSEHEQLLGHGSIVSGNSERRKEEDADEEEDVICFHDNHGKNVLLLDDGRSAERTSSYNQGIVVSRSRLPKNRLVKIRIERLNDKWTASLVIGVIGFPPSMKWNIPYSALDIKRSSWLVHADSVFSSGQKIREGYGPNLDNLTGGSTIGVLVDDDHCLHIYVNDVDLGVAARNLPETVFFLVDLYGQCDRVCIVMDDEEEEGGQVAEGRSLRSHTPVQVQQPELKEKADREDGPKEKKEELNVMRITDINRQVFATTCDYQHLCTRFKATLCLPDGFFLPSDSPNSSANLCCYCDSCCKLRNDAPYYRRGDPAKEFAIPLGWCKFSLRVRPESSGSHSFDKWHVCYHGTRPNVVRRILDTGDLVVVSESVVGSGLTLPRPPLGKFDEKNKPEEATHDDSQPIILSPTIKYAGSQDFASRVEFYNSRTRKTQWACIAFQVLVKPGSYKVSAPQTLPSTLGASCVVVGQTGQDAIDARFNYNELEWSTKEHGATSLCALLIRIE